MELLLLEEKDVKQFKKDMQEAFQYGAIENGDYSEDDELVLPEKDIDKCLNSKTSVAFKVVENNQILGGAIVEIRKNNHNELDFLYVKHGIQSKGIGYFIWNEIEKRYPNTISWETCTPKFEKRNIYFYTKKCGFKIIDKPYKRKDDEDMYIFIKEYNN